LPALKDFETGTSTVPNESNYGLIIISIIKGAEMRCLFAARSEIARLFVLMSEIIAGTMCGSQQFADNSLSANIFLS
jgi:hypothetical protein